MESTQKIVLLLPKNGKRSYADEIREDLSSLDLSPHLFNHDVDKSSLSTISPVRWRRINNDCCGLLFNQGELIEKDRAEIMNSDKYLVAAASADAYLREGEGKLFKYVAHQVCIADTARTGHAWQALNSNDFAMKLSSRIKEHLITEAESIGLDPTPLITAAEPFIELKEKNFHLMKSKHTTKKRVLTLRNVTFFSTVDFGGYWQIGKLRNLGYGCVSKLGTA